MYTTYVVYLVSGIWESMVCGVEVLVCRDKCYVGEGRSTVCWVSLRSVISLMSVLCETSGMLGQQYVE